MLGGMGDLLKSGHLAGADEHKRRKLDGQQPAARFELACKLRDLAAKVESGETKLDSSQRLVDVLGWPSAKSDSDAETKSEVSDVDGDTLKIYSPAKSDSDAETQSEVSDVAGYILKVRSPAVEHFIESFDEDLETFDPYCDSRDDDLEQALDDEFDDFPGLAGLRDREEDYYTTFQEAVDAAWEQVHRYLIFSSALEVNEEDFRADFSKSQGGTFDLDDLLEVAIEPV
eukprot:UN1255